MAAFLIVIGLTGPLLRPVLTKPGIRHLRWLAHPLVAVPLWIIVYYITSQDASVPLIDSDPGKVLCYRYDLVLNGFEIINHCLDHALRRDPRLIIFGEDVGKLGDVNQGCLGLQEKYGLSRVMDTGIRECTIVGQAIGAAMRGALAAGEAQAAMRLAAGAGWYWWLSGHRTEGHELITAAVRTPGEVTDDVRATVYGLVVLFVTSGPGDEHQAAEWIHKAYEFGRRGRGGRRNHPLIGLVAPLERMLREPGAGVSAFEELLAHEDPWARALARLLMGKMRIMLGPDGQGGGPDGQDWKDGQDGQDVDAHLAQAIAEFQSLGERFGISFAQTELAARIAVRGEFAAACEHYEQAIAAIAEVGATEDVIPIRSAQAQSYWLLGDKAASAAALADAERCAERVTWPGSLAVLAFAKAELARWDGDVAQARAQLDVARALLGEEAERANIRSLTYDLLGYLTDDLDEARAHRAAACAAAAEAGHAPVIARVLVGVADLAQRRGDHEQAVRLLAAGEAVLGLTDRSHPDAARIERTARSRLGDTRFAEAALEGRRTGWSELAGVTLAS